MDINYELYKVFYYVATTLSFSEASKQLFISQSAVSQSIKALEKKLDQSLFIRSTKRVQLTPEGEIDVYKRQLYSGFITCFWYCSRNTFRYVREIGTIRFPFSFICSRSRISILFRFTRNA